MPQTAEISAATYRQRIAQLQAAMKELGFGAVVLEPGPAMVYLTGVPVSYTHLTLPTICSV